MVGFYKIIFVTEVGNSTCRVNESSPDCILKRKFLYEETLGRNQRDTLKLLTRGHTYHNEKKKKKKFDDFVRVVAQVHA